MDTTTGTIDPQTGDSTATQSTESTGQGPVESQGSQGQTDNAGGSQDSSEGGKGNGTESRRPYRSKNQTIYELRQSVRERDAKLQEFEQRLATFEQKFQPRQERKPSRTFWEAPEEVMDERIASHLTEMEQRLLQSLEKRDEQTHTMTQMRQETSEAAKLIRSQKGMTEDDIQDIRELLRSDPVAQRLNDYPMEQAEYALYKWTQSKGLDDKTSLKHRAASVQGTPVTAANGKRAWSRAEIEREVGKFPADPRDWTPDQKKANDELHREIKLAHLENRVRN